MDGLYWLIALIVIAAGIYAARYWYHRPSGMPEELLAIYSYDTINYMNSYTRREGEDPEEYDITRRKIVDYLKGRGRGWRQRNDIVGYARKADWIQEFNEQGVKNYRISKAGKQELETAYGLGSVLRKPAQALHDQGMSSDQALAARAKVLAAALRFDARSAPSDSRKQAEALADGLEEAVRSHDLGKISRRISATRDSLQIANYVLPVVRDILRNLGKM